MQIAKRHLFFVILILALLMPTYVYGQFFFMKSPLVGKEAPDFTLKLVNSEKKTYSDYREGKKTIIFFWATWCPHCREQLRELKTRSTEITENGIKLVLIDTGEEEDLVNYYLKKNKLDFEVFLDLDSEVAQQYDLIGLPTFIFIDEKGVVKDARHSIPKNYLLLFAN